MVICTIGVSDLTKIGVVEGVNYHSCVLDHLFEKIINSPVVVSVLLLPAVSVAVAIYHRYHQPVHSIIG